MKSGELRQRVTIQYKSVIHDSFGEEVITWVDLDTVWGRVSPLLGREFLAGKQLEAEINIKINIRYRSGIGPEMRATYGSHTCDILSVAHVEERKRELVLMCKEIL